MVHDGLETYSEATRREFKDLSILPKKLSVWMAPLSTNRQGSSHQALADFTVKPTTLSPNVHITVVAFGYLLLVGIGAPTKGILGKGSAGFNAVHRMLKQRGLVPLHMSDKTLNEPFPLNKPAPIDIGHYGSEHVVNRIKELLVDPYNIYAPKIYHRYFYNGVESAQLSQMIYM